MLRSHSWDSNEAEEPKDESSIGLFGPIRFVDTSRGDRTPSIVVWSPSESDKQKVRREFEQDYANWMKTAILRRYNYL